MLEQLINSKKESSVLGFFLAAPERAFGVLEISKRLGIPYLQAAHTLT